MNNLVLYYFEECPFCRKVLKYIQDKEVAVTYKNIHKDAAAYEELQKIGGKTQVPCLFIDGKPLYESNDILEWIDANIQQ